MPRGQHSTSPRSGRLVGRLPGRSGVGVVGGVGAGLLVLLGSTLGGCGWTQRDELFDRRAHAVPAEAGDGSRLTWDRPATPWSTAEGRRLTGSVEAELQ